MSAGGGSPKVDTKILNINNINAIVDKGRDGEGV